MIYNTTLALETWKTKYRYMQESPLGTQIRVARAVAEVERKYGATDQEVEYYFDLFLKTLVDFREVETPSNLRIESDLSDIYMSSVDGKTYVAEGLKCTGGGRITANAGTEFTEATLLNCFITYGVKGAKISYERSTPDGEFKIPVVIQGSEDTEDDLVNIMVTLMEQAITLSKEGGYGINFDFIRNRGELIKGTGIRHPGVVAYMEVWDKVADMIVRGDSDGYQDFLKDYLIPDDQKIEIEKAMARKGAQMGCLSVSHPDIEEFIRAKQVSGRLTKFNISVVVDREFMLAVRADEMYDLKFDGKVCKRVRALDLWNLLMESSYNRAEPGILFKDNMNKVNPILYMGETNSTNPCFAGDNWVLTTEGPRQVTDLVGKQFTAYVDGIRFDSYKEGFFSSGIKDVYKVTTDRGFSIRVTENHELFRVENGISVKVPVSELKLGDSLALNNQREVEGWGGEGTFDEGWLLGNLVGDGTFRRDPDKACLDFWGDHKEDMVEKVNRIFGEHPDLEPVSGSFNEKANRVRMSSHALTKLAKKFGITSDSKTVTKEVEQASSDFQKGFLQGFFDTDGSPQGSISKGSSVRLSQSDQPCLEAVQRMLARLGVISKVHLNRREAQSRPMPDGRGGMKDYFCKAQHELIISRDSMFRFEKEIGFGHKEKGRRLSNITARYVNRPAKENFLTKITSIEIDGNEEVFDVTIHKAHRLDVNGFKAPNCGEIQGNPYTSTVCLLGSLNLTRYVKADRTFDFEKYKTDVFNFARMLENVNDIGNVPLPHYQWALENVRQYGMGINGLGSALYMIKEQYGTESCLEFVDKVNQIKEDLTWRSSALLAKERGAAPAFREAFFDSPFFKEHCKASDETKDLLRKYGARNLKTTTNPPLGNSSTACDIISNGIEPLFSHAYERTYIVDKWPEGLTIENVMTVLPEIEVGDAIAYRGTYDGRTYYYEPHNRGLCIIEDVEDFGYAWVKANFPEDLEKEESYLVTAQDLQVQAHIDVQATTQRNLNQACSKTVNLPKDYPFEDFKSLYMQAWEKGLVGFTTYRAGTMESVLAVSGEHTSKFTATKGNLLLSLKDLECVTDDCSVTEQNVITSQVSLPKTFLNGPTEKINREGNKYYIHLSYLENDPLNPIAIWIHSNGIQEKEYVTLNRACRAVTALITSVGVDEFLVKDLIKKAKNDDYHVRLGKFISMALRHNVKLPLIIEALSNIEDDYIATTLTAVRKFLSEQVADGTVRVGACCHSCGSFQVIFESGCDKCLDCGASGC